MRLGRLELFIRSFGFDWLPLYSIHKKVAFDEVHYADEHCLHWLMFRVSYYTNMLTYTEILAKKTRLD